MSIQKATAIAFKFLNIKFECKSQNPAVVTSFRNYITVDISVKVSLLA